MRGWLRALFRRRNPIPLIYGPEHASHPDRIREMAAALMWAYRNGYRPVPGYTVSEQRSDGTIYIAVEMTKGD